jgi:hypothetical protein
MISADLEALLLKVWEAHLESHCIKGQAAGLGQAD